MTVERDRRSPPGGSADPEAPRRDRPLADDVSAGDLPGETLSGAGVSGGNPTGDDSDPDPSSDPVSIEDFLVEPTRDLSAWRRLWRRDVPFPIRSHRGFLGRVLVAFKKLVRPFVSVPQNDLWERQRVFNVILLEHLLTLARRRHEDRVSHLEGFLDRGVKEIMAHNDALFARVDQKVDRRSREVRDLAAGLGAALALVEGARPEEGAGSEAGEESVVETLARAREEHAYLELEQRHRGTEREIRERLERYLPYLESATATTGRPVLDLGCGRGEALRVLGEHGLAARGVDGSARMVERCREQGLESETGDLFEVLAAQGGGSLGGVVSFHVIEHLPAPELDRLVRLAHRALAPGGVLILETPNPLSLVAGSRNFWLDPTHRRPVHPESLRLLYELAGFDSVEVLELRPFPESERLPQIDLTDLPGDLHPLADQINRLRDRLDDLLYGAQDFAVVGHV